MGNRLTDKQKLIQLFTEFGIELIINDDTVILQEGNDKVEGYLGFVTSFNFDVDGKFINAGLYE